MQRALYRSLTRTAVTPRIQFSTRLASPAFVGRKNISFRSYSSEAKKQGEDSNANENAKDGESKQGDNSGEADENSSEPQIVQDLKSQLAKKDKDLAELKNHYARAVADFRNLQESTKKEIQKSKDFALQKFAKDLLESVDNFGLALNAVKEDTLKTNEEVKNLYEGVSMTRSVFEKTLSRHGIEKVDPMGEAFDPNMHEATFEIPQPDKEPGTIFHVQQPGYTLNSRVLRPAKVGLVKSDD